MPSPPEAPAYLQYSFLVPVAATVAGWFVVARQSDRREFRKEVREQVKELRELIDAVRDKSSSYWLEADPTKAGINAVGLKAEIARLERHSRTMVAAGLDFDSSTFIGEIREHATGGEFEVKGRALSEDDVGRLSDVAGALEDLLSAVDVAFYAKFQPPQSMRLWRYVPILGALLITKD